MNEKVGDGSPDDVDVVGARTVRRPGDGNHTWYWLRDRHWVTLVNCIRPIDLAAGVLPSGDVLLACSDQMQQRNPVFRFVEEAEHLVSEDVPKRYVHCHEEWRRLRRLGLAGR
jgi:hypothetical protein